MPKSYPSFEELHSVFVLDEIGGELRWKNRPHIRPSANARYVGKVAGSICQRGYKYVTIKKHHYAVHRVIWKMVHNTEPPEIDHIDGDTSNNCLSNLRAADRYTNLQNTKLSLANTSGYKGVSFHRQSGKWRARIRAKGETIDLGLYGSPELASVAYQAEAVSRFGEFARFR